jgi:hypothetical protein
MLRSMRANCMYTRYLTSIATRRNQVLSRRVRLDPPLSARSLLPPLRVTGHISLDQTPRHNTTDCSKGPLGDIDSSTHLDSAHITCARNRCVARVHSPSRLPCTITSNVRVTSPSKRRSPIHTGLPRPNPRRPGSPSRHIHTIIREQFV